MTSLEVFVVYEDPIDFPGRFVVRRQRASAGLVEVDPVPMAVVNTLEEARAVLPRGLARIPRASDDEPQVVEGWV